VKSARDQSGVAVVWAVVLVALLSTVAVVASAAAGLVVAHRQAQLGADLAALAGAGAARDGDDPCTSARRIAHDNRADLTGCTVDGQDVLVRVEVRRTGPFGIARDLRARARAGPAGLADRVAGHWWRARR
jgi:secretion/DNA translocation related TadE-like protein